MIGRRRTLSQDGRAASDTRIGRKLAEQYRPIALQAIAAVVPYQGQRKNAAYAAVASRHSRRTPRETD